MTHIPNFSHIVLFYQTRMICDRVQKMKDHQNCGPVYHLGR